MLWDREDGINMTYSKFENILLLSLTPRLTQQIKTLPIPRPTVQDMHALHDHLD